MYQLYNKKTHTIPRAAIAFARISKEGIYFSCMSLVT